MNPKQLYIIRSGKGLLGHQAHHGGCSVFGFLKKQHAVSVSGFLAEPFVVKKVDETNFMIQRNRAHRRPKLDLDKVIIESRDPTDIAIEVSLNNLKMDLIDELHHDGKQILMGSNYDINIEINELAITKGRLQALYENREFTLDDIMIEEDYE